MRYILNLIIAILSANWILSNDKSIKITGAIILVSAITVVFLEIKKDGKEKTEKKQQLKTIDALKVLNFDLKQQHDELNEKTRKNNLINEWNSYIGAYSENHFYDIPTWLVMIANDHPDWDERYREVVPANDIIKYKKQLQHHIDLLNKQNESN